MAIKTRKHKVSKGERKSVALEVKQDPANKDIHIWEAYIKGQNPWVTVHGNEKNKQFIKVKANDLWGNPKDKRANLFG